MKIRTQFILVFLLLSVVPLTGIVLFSYFSSDAALRRAEQEEASALAIEMEERLAMARRELRGRIQKLGDVPFRALLQMQGEGSEAVEEADQAIGMLLQGLGEDAAFVESFYFVPDSPAAPEPPEVRPPGEAAIAPAAEEETALEIDLPQLLRLWQETPPGESRAYAYSYEWGELDSPQPDWLTMENREIDDRARLREMIRRQMEISREQEAEDFEEEWERLEEDGASEAERRAFQKRRRAETARRRAIQQALRRADREAKRNQSDKWLLQEKVAIPVPGESFGGGEVRLRLAPEDLLDQVFAERRQREGEIQFAVDPEGRILADALDRERLATLGIDGEQVLAESIPRPILDHWVIAVSEDPRTGLSFGIVRPIGRALAELRSAALRNLAFGLALIGFAILGILPLSGRITRDLEKVTEGVLRIADGGDFTTKVEVRSGNEIGQLARVFNRMTQDLHGHQERLVEEESRRLLLHAEYARKSDELEDARAFQLSLLPKRLPEHPRWELAVDMQTATEVGGDYYDYRLSENADGEPVLTLALGDATGHGARAGTMVTVTKSLFSTFSDESGLAAMLSRADDVIREMNLGRMAMALLLARFEGSRLSIASAAMPPALVLRAETGVVEEIALTGTPLGSLASAYEEREVELRPGDLVLMTTDGLAELLDPAGEPLGYDAVEEIFAGCAGKTPQEVIEELGSVARRRTDGMPPDDDMTFWVVRMV